jgi:glycine C-acetyltransferase
MSSKAMLNFFRTEARHLEQAGLLRRELLVDAHQGTTLTVGKQELLNLCSTDYLGLSNTFEVKRAAKLAVDTYGVGFASSRVVAGNVALHVEVETAVTAFLGTEETLVFPSGYHAVTGLFESLVNEKDALFCDAQVQSSIADGVRLCRARVSAYRHADMKDLEERLKRSRAARFRVIVTDGVFPLDGSIAPLPEICELAERYEALVVVEDSHGIGVLGPHGRGAAEYLDVQDRVDLVAGSFGHALGGGAGGFASGRKEIVAWLRQKSRPHLTSTSLSPASLGAAQMALEQAREKPEVRRQLDELTRGFRSWLEAEGFQLLGGEHPTVPILIGDAVKTQRLADLLFKRGIFVMGFCHPVVPEGSARLRAQLTVKHSEPVLRAAAKTMGQAARELGVTAAKK